MCSQWMFSCGETMTNGQDRRRDLERLMEYGCNECSEWASEEMRSDKKEVSIQVYEE
jgi:hypothetical protein